MRNIFTCGFYYIFEFQYSMYISYLQIVKLVINSLSYTNTSLTCYICHGAFCTSVKRRKYHCIVSQCLTHMYLNGRYEHLMNDNMTWIMAIANIHIEMQLHKYLIINFWSIFLSTSFMKHIIISL